MAVPGPGASGALGRWPAGAAARDAAASGTRAAPTRGAPAAASPARWGGRRGGEVGQGAEPGADASTAVRSLWIVPAGSQSRRPRPPSPERSSSVFWEAAASIHRRNKGAEVGLTSSRRPSAAHASSCTASGAAPAGSWSPPPSPGTSPSQLDTPNAASTSCTKLQQMAIRGLEAGDQAPLRRGWPATPRLHPANAANAAQLGEASRSCKFNTAAHPSGSGVAAAAACRATRSGAAPKSRHMGAQ